MSRGLALAALLCVAPLLAAVPARATVGGPTLVEVLGWSPAEQCVYVLERTWDGGDRFGTVYGFALGSAAPESARVVGWSDDPDARFDDPGLVARLAALRRRLVPLAPEPATALPLELTVVSVDTLRDAAGASGCDGVPHFRFRASWYDVDFDVDGFKRPELAGRGVWAVPGRPEKLLVVAWWGTCFEGGYEVQQALLLARPGRRVVRLP